MQGWSRIKTVATIGIVVMLLSGCTSKVERGVLNGAAKEGVRGAMLGNSETAAIKR